MEIVVGTAYTFTLFKRLQRNWIP